MLTVNMVNIEIVHYPINSNSINTTFNLILTKVIGKSLIAVLGNATGTWKDF